LADVNSTARFLDAALPMPPARLITNSAVVCPSGMMTCPDGSRPPNALALISPEPRVTTE